MLPRISPRARIPRCANGYDSAGVYICMCAYVPRRMYADVRICIRTDVPAIYMGKTEPVSHELFRPSIAHISSIAGATRTCRNSEVSAGFRRALRALASTSAAPWAASL